MLHDLHVDEPKPKADPEPTPDEAAQKAEADAKAAEEVRTKEIEAANERVRVADERSQRVMDAYTQMVGAQTTPAAPDPPAANLPDPEEDPNAFMEAKIKQGVEAGLQQHVGPIAQQYRQDRVLTLNTTIEQNKARIRGDASKYPGYGKYEEEINEYMKNYQPDELARPGAIEECYYRVIGRKNAEELSKANTRSSGPETGGRSSGTGSDVPPAPRTELSHAEVRAAARAGMDERSFKALQGNGQVTIDEYEKIKEASK